MREITSTHQPPIPGRPLHCIVYPVWVIDTAFHWEQDMDEEWTPEPLPELAENPKSSTVLSFALATCNRQPSDKLAVCPINVLPDESMRSFSVQEVEAVLDLKVISPL